MTGPAASAPGQNAWHTMAAAAAVAALRSDAVAGLSSEQARQRLRSVGPNALPEPQRRSLLAVFGAQFRSPLIYLLIAAAGLAMALGHSEDAAVIFVVLLANAVIGAVQEGRAENSLAALRQLETRQARVVRDGAERVIAAHDVVPGDILVVEAGDAIAADARLLASSTLQVAEAALTGESLPVDKRLPPLAPKTPLADRENMVYAGTHATAGRAHAVVVATGTQTEIGQIATMAAAAVEPRTPLELRIATFGRAVMVASLAMFALVLGIGTLGGIPFGEILMVGISQVVSMVPEGLPVAMTVVLAVGVQRMARRQAVVRRLAAVETLGSTTVICTDKTGTLTKNEMTVTAVRLADGAEFQVTGVGYEPVGHVQTDGRTVDVSSHDGLREILDAVALCNDAQLHPPEHPGGPWQTIGDPTEVALLALAGKGGVVPSELRRRCPRRAELPFDPTARMMATQHDTTNGSRVYLKGAPEVVFALAAATDAVPALAAAADTMAARALRVLAVGVVDDATIDGSRGFAAFAGRVRMLGLVGQIDPPRPEVADAVAQCRAAGIRPVMVTGDHRRTALAIADELGIARDGDGVVDGVELAALDDDELAARIGTIAVFARVHPAQKLRIVTALQRQGAVVAMTGDGVNDAPALVAADVGVAMGKSGTEVAKQAAKVVLGDDNFATLVAAVEEGRVIHGNLKKLILYLFTTSVAAVVILLLALLLGFAPPLLAVQILWINLVTDGMLTVTLIMEPAEGDEMQRRPIPRAEPILGRALLARVAFLVPAMAASTLGWFVWRQAQGVPFAQVQTETFTVLAVCQWFNVLNCRSAHRSALGMSLLRNPWLIGGLVLGNALQAAVVWFRPLGAMFHTVPIGLETVLAIGAVASLVLWVEELRKLVARRQVGTVAG